MKLASAPYTKSKELRGVPSNFADANFPMRKLTIESQRISSITYVDRYSQVRAGIAPNVYSSTDGESAVLLTNASNIDFNPAISDQEALTSFVVLADRRTLQDMRLAVTHGPDVESTLLEGTCFEGKTNVKMLACPRICLIGYGENPIEGLISDVDVVDNFSQAHGDASSAWIRCVKHALQPEIAEATAKVWEAVPEADRSAVLLGEDFDVRVVQPGSPAIDMLPLPSNYEAERAFMSSLLTSPVSNTSGNALTSAGSLDESAARFAEAFKSKEDRKEERAMTAAKAHIYGSFMGGTYNSETGVLSAIQFPQATTSLIEALNEKSQDEQAQALKRILDSKTTRNLDATTTALEAASSGSQHQMKYCKLFTKGRFTTSRLKSLDDSKTELCLLDSFPKSGEDDELIMREARDEVEELADLIGVSITNITAREQFCTMLANFTIDQFRVMKSVGDASPLIGRFVQEVFYYLTSTDFKEYFEKLSTVEKKLNALCVFLSMLDRLMVGINKASNDYAMHNAIIKEDVSSADIVHYAKACSNFFKDFEETKSIIERDHEIATVSSLVPKSVEGAWKKVKSDQSSRDSTKPASGTATNNGSQSSTRSSAGSRSSTTRSSWGDSSTTRSSWGSNTSKSMKPSFQKKPEWAKTMGSLAVKPGSNFGNVLADTIHCPGFHTIDQCCPQHIEGNCDLKHVPMYRWTPAQLDEQIKHVEKFKDKVLFTASLKSKIPEDKKHLILSNDDSTGN